MSITEPSIQRDVQRAPSKRKMPDGKPWPAGKSPNPGGKTRAQIIGEERTKEFQREFKRVHGRRPYATEKATLAAAGALAGQIEHCRLSADDITRQSNSLWRLLARVGLGSPPPVEESVSESAPPRPSAFEMAARLRQQSGESS